MNGNPKVWERDGGRCFRCGKPVGPHWPGYSFHHRQSRSQGVNTPDNLILLCGSGTTGCHGWVHAHPAESREDGNGWIVSKYVTAGEIPSRPARHYRLGRVCLDTQGGWTAAEQEPSP